MTFQTTQPTVSTATFNQLALWLLDRTCGLWAVIWETPTFRADYAVQDDFGNLAFVKAIA